MFQSTIQMTGSLSINLLGPFEASASGGEPLVVRSRRSRALLACLAMANVESLLDRGPANMDAWSRLQRVHAIVLFNRSAERLADAVRELKQALAVDPDYAMAQARQAIALFSDSPAQWIELTCALGLQGKAREANQAAKVLRNLSPSFTAEGFFEIARKFYGKRFTAAVRNDYRGLCTALQRALP